MTRQFDIVIRGGTIVDGTGAPGRKGDVAIRDGRIAAVGEIAGDGREEIDATGRIVTPGFIDLHTHYDGQVTWEHTLAPSSSHGVTTVLLGNCGVGFAPCRPDDREALIRLMEGVEDVPEVVMAEGLPWNWESFPDYLAALGERAFDIDVAAMVPHSPLRVYVMGQRAIDREPATVEDRVAMRRLVGEAMAAGAFGVSTSRMLFHRDASGNQIPSHGSTVEELKSLGQGLADSGSGVFQLIPDVQKTREQEFPVLEEVAKASGRPLSFTLMQTNFRPDAWREYLDAVREARAMGIDIRGQVAPRPAGILLGLDLSFNPLCRRPSWRAIADLPLAGKVAALGDPAFRAKILAEPDTPHVLPVVDRTLDQLADCAVLEDDPEYLPARDETLGALAAAAGRDLVEYALDRMLERGGSRVIYHPAGGFAEHDTTSMETLIASPDCIIGLGDGGAHYGMICDASNPTTLLVTWVRARGVLTLEEAVRKLTSEQADFVGLADRGRLAPGQLADINVIDLDRLALRSPGVARDLPGGGRRIHQGADGYAMTIKAGAVTYRDGRHTGALPGRLVRSNRAA